MDSRRVESETVSSSFRASEQSCSPPAKGLVDSNDCSTAQKRRLDIVCPVQWDCTVCSSNWTAFSAHSLTGA